MALTESDIKIIIAAELKKAGFDKAKKATSDLEKSFKKLGRTATKTFVAVAGYRALKQSVMAYAQEDKAVRGLTNSLKNLGLGYNTSAIESFIDQTEKATAINKDQLRPAMVQLITTTLDAQKSMKLLNTAMDISAGTGASLDSATSALSKAFNGNFTALGKLQTAYTTAELEAMGFEGAVTALNDLFKGAATTNAESYAGKLDKLQIAAEDAKKEIGKGLVDAISILAEGNFDSGLQKIVDFGEKIGDVFQRAAISVRFFKELLSTGLTIDPTERARLDELANLLRNPDAITTQAGNNPAANRQFLADYKKQQQLQKKIEADRKKAAALAAKAEADRLKREKEAQLLKRAGSVFDMENIQIVAALQGRVSEEQRLRLVALLALNNDNAEAADKLTSAILAIQAPALKALGVTIQTGDNAKTVIERMIEAQTRLFLVNSGIANIPKAKNPFEDWLNIMSTILSNLDQIASKIKNMPSVTTTTATGAGSTTGNSGVGGSTGNTGVGGSGGNVMVGGTQGAGTGSTQVPSGTIIPGPAGSNIFIPDSMTNPNLYGPGKIPYAALAGASVAGPNPAISNLGKRTGDFTGTSDAVPNVTVIVQGSVITEQDLAAAITDYQYNFQRAGGSTLLSSTAI